MNQRSLCLLVVLLSVVLLASCSRSYAQAVRWPQAFELDGDIRQVHDPAIIQDGDTYYLFSTRAGIAIRCSKDLIRWQLCGDVFAHLPEWAVKDVPGLRGLWAPDISYFNGRYHLYYSASTFGSNRSSIGLVTNQTLDQTSERYRWADQGKVISSYSSDDWNAIDPNVVLDEKNEPWLAFGSFWGGIKLRKLDQTTGRLSSSDKTLYALASRSRNANLPGAIEAPVIIRKNSYYYLFVSFDLCCRGKDSTYNIRVGRALRLTGPYMDRSGKLMIHGGGTPVVAGKGRWAGPGHCAVLQNKEGEMLVYHAYDTEWRGIPTLRIARLLWDPQGWPRISGRSTED
ncbi:MAG TPA: arabinan endo-1,5-alpha-L-arabinosidase [Pyrinomonadaceae bacterium]|nr:arabinan endo-1,5-alpha-L-arabinosidase [Pyrinomonadaceae bacterium]